MLIGNSLERNSMPGIGHGFRRSLVGLKQADAASDFDFPQEFQTVPRGVEASTPASERIGTHSFQTVPRGVEAC